MYSIALHSISNAVPIICLIRVSILVYLSTGKLDVELAVFLSVHLISETVSLIEHGAQLFGKTS